MICKSQNNWKYRKVTKKIRCTSASRELYYWNHIIIILLSGTKQLSNISNYHFLCCCCFCYFYYFVLNKYKYQVFIELYDSFFSWSLLLFCSLLLHITFSNKMVTILMHIFHYWALFKCNSKHIVIIHHIMLVQFSITHWFMLFIKRVMPLLLVDSECQY